MRKTKPAKYSALVLLKYQRSNSTRPTSTICLLSRLIIKPSFSKLCRTIPTTMMKKSPNLLSNCHSSTRKGVKLPPSLMIWSIKDSNRGKLKK